MTSNRCRVRQPFNMAMKLKPPHKKQPEIVRANLLTALADLIAERGLSHVTLDLVALKAGVSKGGLFHHFASKQALHEELCRDVLRELDKNINDCIKDDPEPKGRFLRAYIRAFLKPLKTYDTVKLFRAFVSETSRYPSIMTIYRDWFNERLQKQKDSPLSLKAKMIFYAIDGIWLEECLGVFASSPKERETFVKYLIDQTYHL